MENYIINPFMIVSIVVGIYIYRMQTEYQESYGKLVTVLQKRMNKIRLKLAELNIEKCKKIFKEKKDKSN